MRRITLLLLVIISAFAAVATWAQETAAPAPVAVNRAYAIQTDRAGAALNWHTGQLEAVGVGYAINRGEIGKRQARATALSIMGREARRVVATIQADASGTLGVTVGKNDLRTLTDSLSTRLTIVQERWDARNGTITLVGVVSFYGDAGATGLGAQVIKSSKALTLKPGELLITAPMPKGQTPQLYKEGPYTGIIVNGDGALLTPCLYPRIMRFDGQELWGPSQIAPDAMLAGPVRYAPNLKTALAEGLAGERPYIVEAVGNAMSLYPVINLDDVYYLLREQKYQQLLKNVPVVITLGKI